MNFLDCHAFFNYLMDENEGCLHLNASAGISEEVAKNIEWLALEEAVCGCVAYYGQKIVVENILETPDPRTKLIKPLGIKAYACHPLMDNKKVLGTLSFGTCSRTQFSDEDIAMMKAVKDAVAIAITRFNTEEALRENEARQTFFLKMSDAIRPLSDAVEIQATVTRMLMDYFEADRCYYCEFEGDFAIIQRDASRGDLPSVVGIYSLSSLPIFKAVTDAGGPIVVPDVNTTELVDKELRQLCIQMKIISYINIQVMKGGKPAGNLCITQCTPRNWTDFEVELAVETAERTWAAVERAHAEATLRESEAKYRRIVETSQEGIWLIDGNDKTIFINQRMSEMLGYSIEEILGQSPQKFMPPEFREKAGNRLHEHMQGANHVIDHKFTRKDGSDLWCILSSHALFDDKGDYAGSLAMITDITERKQYEHQLFDVNQRLEAIMSALPVGVSFSYDLTSQKTTGNPAALAQFEMSPEDDVSASSPDGNTPGKQIRYFLNGKQINDTELPLQRAVAENREIPAMEFEIELPSGRRWFAEASGAPIHNEKGNVVGGVAVSLDITERKEAEEKIKILANAVESSNDAIITESLEGFVTSWNKGAEQIYGDSAEEMLGKNTSVLEPANIKGEMSQLIEKIKQGERIQHHETLRLKKDGTIINVSLTHSPVFNTSGELVAISDISRDVTERIKTERTLANIETARLKEIHHRIKNNLQVISSLLDLQAGKFRDKEVIEAFKESQDRVISMKLIHEELYKGNGTDTLNFSAYLQKLAENLFQTYNLRSKNIHLYMDLEENAFFNLDIAVPLGIIVNELISNILKHAFTEAEEGEIRIQLSREKADNKADKSLFSLIISDNGRGIAQDIKFENLESLGLQLVNALVNQLDGKIEIKRDHGTEFRITFNVVEDKFN
jgi:PAS domain S-box-containing protein